MTFSLHPSVRPWAGAVFIGALTLAGCAPLSEKFPAGSSYSAIRASMGDPTLTCPAPNGGERAIWSGQPYLQTAWATTISPDGSTTGMEQVLTDASFRRLRDGTVWDMDRLICTFGPPADRAGVGLPGHVQRVWSYKYKQDSVWNSLMHVYFDDAGIVTRFHPGPDPEYEVPSEFGMF